MKNKMVGNVHEVRTQRGYKLQPGSLPYIIEKSLDGLDGTPADVRRALEQLQADYIAWRNV